MSVLIEHFKQVPAIVGLALVLYSFISCCFSNWIEMSMQNSRHENKDRDTDTQKIIREIELLRHTTKKNSAIITGVIGVALISL